MFEPKALVHFETLEVEGSSCLYHIHVQLDTFQINLDTFETKSDTLLGEHLKPY